MTVNKSRVSCVTQYLRAPMPVRESFMYCCVSMLALLCRDFTLFIGEDEAKDIVRAWLRMTTCF